ncbi:MAG: TIGR00266 family protein [Opitutales bacterium]|nr:TIGR00266 family protein [Opitutales bacterium]
MKSHEVDYEIYGDDMQAVEVELDPSETVIAEAGAMNWMEEGIQFEAKMGDGSDASSGVMGKLLSVGKRMLTGESLFMTHFTNRGSGKSRVAFAAPYPGRIIPVELSDVGGTILCQKDAFLCAALGTKVSIAFNKKLGAGFFGGEGFILQKLQGDGKAFIHAGGTVIKKELSGETLRIDTGCIVAFSEGIDYSIERAGNLKSMFFGGEGLFLATLRGHGTVYLQTLPFSRLADRIIKSAPSVGGKSQGEGSALGGLGRLLDGDN